MIVLVLTNFVVAVPSPECIWITEDPLGVSLDGSSGDSLQF